MTTRSATGMSLIEVLSAMFIMSFVAAAMCEIAFTQNVVAFRSFNRSTGLMEANRFQAQLEHEIHMARFIGSQYGNGSNAPGNLNGANSFPVSQDPYYGSGSPPAGFLGYPASTSNSVWPSPPNYSLSPQTLIIQVPIFDQDGFPTGDGYGLWNVDTYVYQILADSTKPGLGQFVMQKTVFPGVHTGTFANNAPPYPSNDPQTVVNGIVGPINPLGPADPTAGTPKPSVFGFFTGSAPTYVGNPNPILSTPLPSQANNLNGSGGINGVSVNMEIFSGGKGQSSALIPQTVPLHCEYFARSNLVSQ